jgi:hypothetical protein
MGWTPQDLTSEDFVRTKLSASDRSYALNSTTRELDRVSARFPQLEKDYLAAQDAFNNRPNRGDINELKALAKNPALSEEERAAALEKATTLQNERDRLSDAYYKLDTRIRDDREYLRNLTVGQSNLLQAGAVPPGTSMFAAPPGYEGRKTPPQDVPASENPNPTPAADNSPVNRSVPQPVAGEGPTQASATNTTVQKQVTEDPGATQAEADFINAEAQKQVEAELGASQAEIDFIKGQEQVQYETELGATQNEADFITKAQLEADQNEYAFGGTQAEADFIINEQKQISEFESSLGAAGATQAEADAINQALADDAEAFGAARGFTGLLAEVQNTREQAITQDTLNYNQLPDWRVRISLAQGADYLYKVQNPGILKPLQATNGVVFPYTPSIQMAYVSNYDAFDLLHSNYKIFQYKSSAIEQLTISADFTAQDATEASYVLAVIHFFRTVTKMFYGKDQNPKPGTPPPLCYISGMGDFQFNQHPLVISNFGYTLPNDVDYIRAGAPTLPAGQSSSGYSTPNNSTNTSTSRMQSNNVPAGGQNAAPNWTTQTNIEPTYIPTKMQVSITALPIVTRKDISDNFSVREYATGALMRGRQNSRGGIW